MRKLISLMLSAAMVSSIAAVPVFAENTDITQEYISDAELGIAEYNPAEYDITMAEITDETVLTDRTNIFYPEDSTIFTKEFYMGMDIKFDSSDAYLYLNSLKSSGSDNKIGPNLSITATESEAGVLRTQTGSTSYQTLCENISLNTWYRIEFEGKMVVSDASVTFRIYDENGTLLNTVEGMNLRQFYAGASNGNPTTLLGGNITYNNFSFIAENPDVISISSTDGSSDLNAGQVMALDYEMTRLGNAVTKGDVEWSVDGGDENISITKDGVLSAGIDALDQDVTVKASAVYGDKTLVGEYPVSIHAVSTENEKFDAIAVSGDSSLKAGTSIEFTFTASKGGTDVTNTLTEEDVVWSIYDAANLVENKNLKINIDNGVLTVEDDVMPQNIYVRASTPSGTVFGSAPVEILWSDSQLETVLDYNSCESAIDGMSVVDSWDGSNALLANAGTKLVNFANTTGYIFVETDIKFTTESSGLVLKRADGGKTNTAILYRDGAICGQSGSSTYPVIMSGAELNKWYHIEVIYSADFANAACNIYEINADGTLGQRNTFLDINMRNADTTGTVEIQPGAAIDNIKVVTPSPDEVSLNASSENVFAGYTVQVTPTVTRKGLTFKDTSSLVWRVTDMNDIPLEGELVTVSPTGLVTIDPMAEAQDIKVSTVTSNGSSAFVVIHIQSSDIYTVNNLGVNEDKTKIAKMYVTKSFYYTDDATFIVAIHDKDGVLKGMTYRTVSGKNTSIGDNEISLDFTLPDNFDAENDTISTMVWTKFGI